MDLQAIRSVNFEGLPDAELVLDRPVTVVMGDNNSGKSSVRDVIEYALTGLLPSRDVVKKTQAGVLALDKSKPFKAGLKVDGAEFSRSAKSATLAEQEIARRFGRPELVAAVLGAFNFVELTPAERADLVRAISSDPEKIRAGALAALKGAGISEADAKYLAGLAAENMDKAEQAAVEKRREAKRRLDETPEDPPAKGVSLGGTDWSLADTTVKELEDHAAEVRRERKGLDDQRIRASEDLGRAKRSASPEERNARMAELNAELKKLGNADNKQVEEARKAVTAAEKDVAAAQRDVPAAEKVRAELSRAVDEARAAYSLAKGQKEAAAARLKDVENLTVCPTCDQVVEGKALASLVDKVGSDGNVAAENMKLATARGKEAKAALCAAEVKAEATAAKVGAAEAKLAATTARWQALKEAAYKAEGCRLELTALRQRATDAKEDAAAVETLSALMVKLDVDLQSIDKRLELGAELLKAKREYDAAVAAHDGRDALKAARDAWDNAQKALGDGGPVRKLASAGFNKAEVQAHVTAVLGGTVDVDDSWGITYTDEARGTRGKAQLSRSERFRLGACFAASLSKAAGLGLLVLDEGDILAGNAKDAFLVWLGSIAPDFNRILVLATKPTPPEPSTEDWLGFAWVEDGKVSVVDGAAVTA